jgi:hypothetical protein
MLRTLLFVSLITSAFASLDGLVTAAQSFAAAIEQQITTAQSDPSPTDFAGKTVAYADAKISYYNALRAAMPDLANIATGKEPRPPEVNKFRDAFRVAGEIQEIAADKETAALLKHSRAIPTLKRRGPNSSVLKRSKSYSIWISTGSISPATLYPLRHVRKSIGRQPYPETMTDFNFVG